MRIFKHWGTEDVLQTSHDLPKCKTKMRLPLLTQVRGDIIAQFFLDNGGLESAEAEEILAGDNRPRLVSSFQTDSGLGRKARLPSVSTGIGDAAQFDPHRHAYAQLYSLAQPSFSARCIYVHIQLPPNA